MVNFGEEMSKNYSIDRLECAENNHSAKPKNSKLIESRRSICADTVSILYIKVLCLR